MSCNGNCDECDNFLDGYKQLTSYTAGSNPLPQSQWVVENSAVVMRTVPALTEFISAVDLFHSSIWNQVKKNGVLKVSVMSGTVKFLTTPMGSTGAVDYGDIAPKQFIIETGELMGFNWASSDSALVRIEAYGKVSLKPTIKQAS